MADLIAEEGPSGEIFLHDALDDSDESDAKPIPMRGMPQRDIIDWIQRELALNIDLSATRLST